MKKQPLGFLSFIFSLCFVSQTLFAKASDQIKIDVLQTVRETQLQINADNFTAEACAGVLKTHLEKIQSLRGEHLDIPRLKNNSEALLAESWQLRLSLQQKLKVFHQGQQPPLDCVQSARKFLNIQRDIEDYVGQLWQADPASRKADLKMALRQSFPHTLVNSRYNDFKFPEGLKSGDILMSRGRSFVSAAIARSSESEGQFSHLSLIYIDEKTGKIYTIESHIETGVLIRPLEFHFQYKNLREVIYRYPDEQMARLAAKSIYDLARKYKEPDTWPYDFERNMDDDSAMDCTEIVRTGFKIASNNKIRFPMYTTKLPKNLMPFVYSIGVKTDISFSPEDIEIDPRVEMIAEWRDFTQLQDMRSKNQILSSIFDWMQDQNYSLKFTLSNVVSRNGAWHLRHWPFYLLRDRIPITMPKEFIGAGMALEDAGEMIQERFEIKSKRLQRQRGYPLTSSEVYSLVEVVRQEDWQLYLEGSYKNSELGNLSWPFHEILRSY